MDLEKLTKLISRKYFNLDEDSYPLSAYFNEHEDFALKYFVDSEEANCVVIVGNGTSVYNCELFKDWELAEEYLRSFINRCKL